MKIDEKVDYYGQGIEKVWGGSIYRTKYGQGDKLFSGRDVPYQLSEMKNSSETVLEIGSSMGQCYRWLLTQGIDLKKRYTGTDISEEGITHSKQAHPQANWIQADFSTASFPQFDYVHERISIHHMPNPHSCIKKAISLGKKAIILNMRSRTLYPSVSDLNKAYFVQWSDDGKQIIGKYFFNLLNVADIANTILSCPNVESLRIELSPHAPLSNKKGPIPDQNFVAPEDAYDPKETLYLCHCFIRKGNSGKKPKLSIVFASKKQAIKHPSYYFRFLKNRKLILKNVNQ